jgi:hypothetical protein
MATIRRQAVDWARLIDQWRQSGLSLPAFCQRHGLKPATMQNWVYKPALQRAVEQAKRQAQSAETSGQDSSPLPEPSPSFLPIRITEAASVSAVPDRTGVEIVLGAGRRIVVGPGFDPETLRRVVVVLEGLPC